MTDEQRRDLIIYRIENAENTLKEVASHCENHFWNTAVNRMYYACYYAVCALLLSRKTELKTHAGVRQKFGEFIVTTKLLDKSLGHFYSQLFGKRSQGDYEDFFNNDQKTTEAMLPQAEELIKQVKALLKQDNWL